jgi:phosphogluconate dehydratase
LSSWQRIFQATGGTAAGGTWAAPWSRSRRSAEYRSSSPAPVFSSQHAVEAAYKAGDLTDAVIVVRQWPGRRRHAGAATSDAGARKTCKRRVTRWRWSPMAVSPAPPATRPPSTSSRKRCIGAIGLLADGDLLRVDAVTGRLDCLTDLVAVPRPRSTSPGTRGWGRELFSVMRRAVSSAECGATIFD